jgi:hypothetical protein
MPPSHASRARELDPKRLTVHLSEQVKDACANLAASMRLGEHCDRGILESLEDWAAGKAPSVDDLVGSLPLIAEHTFNHVYRQGDERARRAWQELGHALLEQGFTLSKARGRND